MNLNPWTTVLDETKFLEVVTLRCESPSPLTREVNERLRDEYLKEKLNQNKNAPTGNIN